MVMDVNTFTTAFQNGCITHLLRGLLSTALYCNKIAIQI